MLLLLFLYGSQVEYQHKKHLTTDAVKVFFLECCYRVSVSVQDYTISTPERGASME